MFVFVVVILFLSQVFFIISIQGGASDLGGESSASAESDDVSTNTDYNDYDEIVHADDWDRQ